MTFVALLLGLGVLAGLLTTTAGLGGGLLLLIALSLLVDPIWALAATTPALLVGNLHRSWMYRARVRWPLVRAFAIGAVPGAALGGVLAVSVPKAVIAALMLAVTIASLVRSLGKLDLTAPPSAITPAGFVIGGLTGSAGGAAVLTAPLFLSAGLVGETFAGTIAASGVAMHFGRIAGYGAGGLMTRELWLWAAVLALAVTLGNTLGTRLRHLSERLPPGLIEHVVLVICTALALTGLGRS